MLSTLPVVSLDGSRPDSVHMTYRNSDAPPFSLHLLFWCHHHPVETPCSVPQGTFSYSTDGSNFTRVGNGFTMNKDWHFFMGYRFAIFNYATASLGGSVLACGAPARMRYRLM